MEYQLNPLDEIYFSDETSIGGEVILPFCLDLPLTDGYDSQGESEIDSDVDNELDAYESTEYQHLPDIPFTLALLGYHILDFVGGAVPIHVFENPFYSEENSTNVYFRPITSDSEE